MTTRREFVQGVLAGMVALVLPKTAKGGESDEPVVEPEHGLRIDGMVDSYVHPSIILGDKAYWSWPFLPIGEVEDGLAWSPEITGDGSGIALPEVSSAKLYGPGHIDWIHFPECSIGKLADE